MWRGLVIAILLAGCVQLAPAPQNLQAKKFEALPDRAVVYLVRDLPVLSERPVRIWLGNQTVTTRPGTCYRWEVVPATHRIAGDETDFGRMTLEVEPGKIYFVEQQLSLRYDVSYFYPIDETEGRSALLRGVLLKGY